MKSALAAILVLFFVQLVMGVPLVANNDGKTTKHWEIEPREKTTKHWEVPEIQPRDGNQDSVRDNESLPIEVSFWGGDGTLPPVALDNGGVKEISMVPYGLVEGTGTLPPGAVNDGGVKEISMVPYGLEEGTTTVNDGSVKEISMVPFGVDVGTGTLPPGAVNDNSDEEISMVPFEKDNGTMPPRALNEGNAHVISMVPYVIRKVPFDATLVPEGPWEAGQGTVPPGALNDESSSPFMRGARFILRAFGL